MSLPHLLFLSCWSCFSEHTLSVYSRKHQGYTMVTRLYTALWCGCSCTQMFPAQHKHKQTHPVLFAHHKFSYMYSEVCIVLHKTASLNCTSSLTPSPAVFFLPLRCSCVRVVDFALFMLTAPLTPQPNMAGVMLLPLLLLLLLLRVKGPRAKE